MIRFTPTSMDGSAAARGFDLVRAALVLAALIGAGVYLAPKPSDRIAGHATAIDGDSLRLDGAEIRLTGLDAPELHQTCARDGRAYACGEAARGGLAQIIAGGPLACEITGRDRYRRRLARCTVGGRDIGALLVGRGLAVAYGAYTTEEVQARRDKVGLWAGAFQRPADWRKEHPRP